ncbi:UNVERIFIED_CONTAM: hypothetical protein HDU68_000869, partial [Siphonaria sp. JEL0065]
MAEGILFGTINVLLLISTLVMEIRFLLNGPPNATKRSRTESAHGQVDHNANSLINSGRVPTSPSVRAV